MAVNEELIVLLALLMGLILGIAVAYVWTRRRYEAKFEAKRKQFEKQSRAGLKGKLGEQFAPIWSDFVYNPSDARFVGSPVDFVVFDGYSGMKEGVSEGPIKIVLVEVKSSRKARLSPVQSFLRDAIGKGQVGLEFKEFRSPEWEAAKTSEV
jgi:predicted Holliday junction resolvase-like endonuclease